MNDLKSVCSKIYESGRKSGRSGKKKQNYSIILFPEHMFSKSTFQSKRNSFNSSMHKLFQHAAIKKGISPEAFLDMEEYDLANMTTEEIFEILKQKEELTGYCFAAEPLRVAIKSCHLTLKFLSRKSKVLQIRHSRGEERTY